MDGVDIGSNIKELPAICDGQSLYLLYAQARGCAFGDDIVSRWREVAECESETAWQGFRNTYMQLKPEPENRYDGNAIEVLARGEFFGRMGYIAKEQTANVRRLAEITGVDVGDLGVMVANHDDIGWKNVPLIIWALGTPA